MLHRDLHPDQLLDRGEGLDVVLAGEGDRPAGLAGARRPADPVDVVLRVHRQVDVDDVRDAVDVEAARRHVGRDEDRELSRLEVGEDLQPLRLGDVARDRSAPEAVPLEAVDEPLGEALRVDEEHRPRRLALPLEDADEEGELLRVADVEEALDDPVGRHPLGGDLDPLGLVHVLPGELHDAPGEGRREHHRAAAPGRRAAPEDAAQVGQEAEVEEAVALVDDEALDRAERRRALPLVVEEAARGADQDVAAVPEQAPLPGVVEPAVDGHDAGLDELREEEGVVLDLDRQLPRRGDDERPRRPGLARRRRGAPR